MTQPSAPDAGGTAGNGEPREPVDLEKAGTAQRPAAEARPEPEPFDPYRFGKPDHPIPPEFAPPGYTATGYTPMPGPSPYGSPPYGSSPAYGPPPPYGSQPLGGQAPHNPAPGSPPPYPSGYQYTPGAPPPPPYHAYPQPRTGNGKATASLVLGILSILFFWLSLFDGVLIILGLIFGLLGLSDSKRIGGHGRGMAIAGLTCVAVGAAAAMLWTAMLVHAVDKCGGLDSSDTDNSVFEQCISDHLWFK